MLLTVEPDGDVPIYQQLRDQIVLAVAAGVLVPGDSLPTTRQLAADLEINMHTVNKAYDLLRREGLVRLGRRTGAVVARGPGAGPASAQEVGDWERRARTLLAEGFAKGMAPPEVLARCQALLGEFTEH
ncbi:GntR family transcriptional regulator [Catenulispora sp. NF23]|uniref:GntR family transcriptional regulator n=1 Tax=Catenulispora pinistramenti TaxID=2705254 RepID=A0ABS5KND2_9ACTN|nr:GntR family transcriptional regulator [Catenulispora pinistramenti]MBS2536497.1 GntR family transcriptional regulator [Catenulispora pinistramenti]MBS2547561.1 GntR family transcriptional regulator [Catenulispora pinistramenti]